MSTRLPNPGAAPSKGGGDDATVGSDSDSLSERGAVVATAAGLLYDKKQLDGGSSAPSAFPARRRRDRQLGATSIRYDLDGDGVLNEAEQAMRDMDESDRGYLTNDQIYSVVREQLRAARGAGRMKMVVAGLVCFVVVLALSNLGTSWASAALARDLAADNMGGVPVMRAKGTGEIAAAQTTADVYEAVEMSDEEFEERRRLVLAEMEEDPHSHAHRRDLRRCKGCMGEGGNSRISFDSSYVDDLAFDRIEGRCKQGRNVYLKIKKGDGISNHPVCSRGTSVVVKQRSNDFGRACPSCMGETDEKDKGKNKKDKDKKKNKKNNGGGNKKGRNREVIIEQEDGRIFHADCKNGRCYTGGSSLQGSLFDRCKLHADECGYHQGRRLVCERERKARGRSSWGACVLPAERRSIVTKFARLQEVCLVSYLSDACEGGLWCDPDGSGVTGVCARRAGWGQTCWHHSQCDVGGFCDGWGDGWSDGWAQAGRRTGVCRRAEQFASVDEVCYLSYGENACERGLTCVGGSAKNSARAGFGSCRQIRSAASGSGEWYVDYQIHQCVRSCASGQYCGGEAERYEATSPTAQQCCQGNLWWITLSKCVPGYF